MPASDPQKGNKEFTTVELAEYISSRTVTVNAGNSIGSGFFISSDGVVVTN